MSKINWEKIKEDYLIHKDGLSLKEFAEKHKVKYSTLRSRKNREKWDSVATDDAPNRKNNKIEYKKEIEKLEDADLTDKQRLFCIEYVKCFNATKAYQKVYQCSYNAAMTEGFKHLGKPKIKEQIKNLKQAKLNRAMLDENDIFQKYIDIAFSDITDYVEFGNIELPLIDKNTNQPRLDKNGKPITTLMSYVDLKDSKKLDGTIISEVSKGKDGAKVKLHDKMKALEWLSERMDLLTTATKKRLELEREKLKNQDEVEEYEDDGFIDALKDEVGEVWDD